MDDLFSPGFLAGLDRELNAGLANGPGDAHLPRAAWDAGGLPGFDQPEPVDGTADPLFAEDGSVVVFTQDDWDANSTLLFIWSEMSDIHRFHQAKTKPP